MRISLPTFIIFVSTATLVGAQSQTTNRQTSGATAMLTGCVTRADMSYASGRRAVDGRAVTSGGEADRFVLVTTKGATDGRIGTTGSTDPVAMKGAKYDLLGESADLRPHLGHEIEATGHFERVNPNSSSTDAPAALGKDEPNLPKFRVDSVRMISAACEAK